MPRKAIYWRNPEKHRAEFRKRYAYVVALGAGKYWRSSEALAKRREENKEYRRKHQAANCRATRRYRRKLQRLFGNCARRAVWQHTQLKQEQNAAKRKQAIALLPRELVEGRTRMHLVSSRYSAYRALFESRQVVLLRRSWPHERPLRLSKGSGRSLGGIL